MLIKMCGGGGTMGRVTVMSGKEVVMVQWRAEAAVAGDGWSAATSALPFRARGGGEAAVAMPCTTSASSIGLAHAHPRGCLRHALTSDPQQQRSMAGARQPSALPFRASGGGEAAVAMPCTASASAQFSHTHTLTHVFDTH